MKKKNYIVSGTLSIGYELRVKAGSQIEAHELAENSDFEDWEKVDEGHDFFINFYLIQPEPIICSD